MRGTEFVVAVAANGSTTVTMLDGEVELSNAQGSLVVSTGEQAKVDVGGRPRKTAVLEAINSVQWCLYYPGVLDLKELGYRRGPIRRSPLTTKVICWRPWPPTDTWRSGSDADNVYHAGLLLAVGQVDKAERLLNAASPGTAGTASPADVDRGSHVETAADSNAPQTASDWIAESYYLQSQANLPGALEAAQHATEIDPEFGFAWTRVAELHFSFGRVPQAKAALEKGIAAFCPQSGSACAPRLSVAARKTKSTKRKRRSRMRWRSMAR